MQCGVVSYQGGQILAFRFIWIQGPGWCREIIKNSLRPNWFSSAPDSVITSWLWRRSAHHGARELSRIAVIQIGSGHVGTHECRPCADGWITGGKGSAGWHERQVLRRCVNRLNAELMAPTKRHDLSQDAALVEDLQSTDLDSSVFH
jgi:hypothetical protein